MQLQQNHRRWHREESSKQRRKKGRPGLLGPNIKWGQGLASDRQMIFRRFVKNLLQLDGQSHSLDGSDFTEDLGQGFFRQAILPVVEAPEMAQVELGYMPDAWTARLLHRIDCRHDGPVITTPIASGISGSRIDVANDQPLLSHEILLGLKRENTSGSQKTTSRQTANVPETAGQCR
ncbi:MAG: hypothetical protein ACKO26_26015, partial [Planctomycetota bacterium]